MNELKNEKSPYLLQHKDNPVWWRSWSAKTFKSAIDQNKLILLSIGYATCHWCHVMEHESFEDSEVAKLLNENYISIKVDREELPDVDQIYMNAIHAMGQRGGWPLNMILTPQLHPIYGGTYFPKPQFTRMLSQISELWKTQPQKVIESGSQVYQFLHEQAQMKSESVAVPLDIWKTATEHFKSTFDSQNGGFGEAPKFPPNTQLQLLCRLFARTQDGETLMMIEKTLREMSKGGLYDQIGGGFYRYSVDGEWRIPHFEKMLYVNSQTAINLLEVFQITQNKEYLEVATDTLNYVLREMLSSKAGFYTAEDADSLDRQTQKKEEGLFYVWSLKELSKILDEKEFRFVQEQLGAIEPGNFENGLNHFYLSHSDSSSSNSGFWQVRKDPLFLSIQKKLLDVCEKRERPLLDDKQLTSWNALMITAMCKAFRVTGDSKYLDAALQSAKFIKSTLSRGNQLYRRYRDGESKYDGTLDDYAFLIQGLIELYQSTFDDAWLLWALDLQKTQIDKFSDTTLGLSNDNSKQPSSAPFSGFFYTEKQAADMIVRTKDFADNAIPNSNAVSAWNLITLGHYFGESQFRNLAQKIFESVGEALEKFPSAFSTLLVAYDLFENENSQQLAAVEKLTPQKLQALSSSFHPNLILASGENSTLPILTGKDKNKFYLCRNGACDLPESDWATLLSKL